MRQKNDVFKDFEEFWFHTRKLSEKQRDVIFHSLPTLVQKKIKKSYKSGGWEDLFIRNQIDKVIDKIKKDMDFDVIYMRCRVLMGKSFYVKKSLWQYINDVLSDFTNKHKQHIFGNIKVKDVNDQVVLLLKED